jgi:ATP-dependent Lon protease
MSGLFTNHFGLVSDFLSECFTQLRGQSRVSDIAGQGVLGLGIVWRRPHWCQYKSVNGLLKLVYSDSDAQVSDEDLEWAARLALEVRHRVKEQQKRTGAAGFETRISATPWAPTVLKNLSLRPNCTQLVGDRDPRAHEFSIQLRGFYAARSGAKTWVASPVALASALLKKSVRGGLVLLGEVTLGGTIEPIHNAVSLAELAVEK